MFSHISGSRMLDLVNTVEWRLSADLREEDLTTYEDVAQWCHEAELLSESERAHCGRLAGARREVAEGERQAVIALREATYATLLEQDTAAATKIADAYRAAVAAAELRPDGSSWTWSTPSLELATPRHRIALGLMDLLRREDLDRLHQCEDEACGWVYFDTSPRRNRRWCVTSDCGDRNRSRAYYARQKAKRRS